MKPQLKYYPRPLWFWNGPLSKESIATLMQKSKEESGYGGFGIIGCDVSGIAYLEAEYLEHYRTVLETAERLDMKICLYDEWWFPSGSAGGRLARFYPEALAKRLDKVEYPVAPGEMLTISLEQHPLMAAVAVHKERKACISLRQVIRQDGGKTILQWETAEPGWTAMVFYCVPDGWDHVDYLDPASVEKFIAVTHEVYYQHFASYFGNVIDSTFYDEPQFYTPRGRMWTPAFNEKFEQTYGYNPELYYPALWYDMGPDTEAARCALLGFRAELYASGFPKTIQNWCTAHGIALTGHVDQEEMINPTGITGDLMKSFREQDIPGVDEISHRRRGEAIFKLVSSAAYNWDKPLVMTETFGAMGEGLGVQGLYQELMEQFVRGINLIVPHAVWQDGKDNVIFPPELSWRSEQYGPHLKEVNTYAARVSQYLQGGRHIADVAVLYPIYSLQAAYYMDWGEPYHGGPVLPEFDYQQIGTLLTNEIHTDYTWLHPEVLDEKCTVEGNTLSLSNVVNYERFRVLIVPGGKVISLSNMEKIRAFYDRGGKVIFTTQTPCVSKEFGKNAKVAALVEEMLAEGSNGAGGKAIFMAEPTKDTLQKAIQSCLKNGDVSICTTAETDENGSFSYLHKEKDGKQIYFFANSSLQEVDATVRLCWEKGADALQCFHPHTGQWSSLEGVTKADTWVEFSLHLDPVQSLFIIG